MRSQGGGTRSGITEIRRVESRGACEATCTEPSPSEVDAEPSTSPSGSSGGDFGATARRPAQKSTAEDTAEDAASLPRRREDVGEGTSPSPGIQAAARPGSRASERSGTPVQVYATFFRLIVNNPQLVVCRYKVTIEPDHPKALMRTVWQKFARSTFPQSAIVFDGSQTAYSRDPLFEGDYREALVRILNFVDSIGPADLTTESEFRVSVRKVNSVDFSIFENYPERFRDMVRSSTSLEEQRKLLEFVMKNWAATAFLGSDLVLLLKRAGGRGALRLSERPGLRHGFYQTVCLGSTPHASLDDSCKVFYREVSLLEVFERFRSGRTGKVDVGRARERLGTTKILYYGPHNAAPRFYKVKKLVNDAFSTSFRRADGSMMRVADYFGAVRKTPLKYPEFPLVCAGSSADPTFLPAELCTLAFQELCVEPADEGEPDRVKGPPSSVSSSVKGKQKRSARQLQAIELLGEGLTKEFELTFARTWEKVSARVLEPPELNARTKLTVKNGIWAIQDLLEPTMMTKWCTVSLDQQASREKLARFEDVVMRKGSELGMKIGSPARQTIETDSSREAIKEVFSQLRDMDIVFVVIPPGKSVYSRLKTICEVEEGILTQCLQGKNLSAGEQALATLVASLFLKVNTKLGGRNFSCDESSIPECLRGCALLVGIDVAHPRAGTRTPAVSGVAASSDPTSLNYEIITRVQVGEIIPQLEDVMNEHLDRFRAARNRFPERVIVFRDGVAAADWGTLVEIELSALKRACSSRGSPRITVVAVQKKNQTRMFPIPSRDERAKNSNVLVGTCLDSDVVRSNETEFVLVSHSARVGTPKPTKYRVLHDENRLAEDELERLTFYVCHLSPRSQMSQSRPCPTQYAHLVATRTRVYIEEMDLTVADDPRMIQERIENRISSTNPMFFV